MSTENKERRDADDSRYRDLLVKYMRLIIASEGVDYLNGSARHILAGEGPEGVYDDAKSRSELAIDGEEWAELQRLAEEARR